MSPVYDDLDIDFPAYVNSLGGSIYPRLDSMCESNLNFWYFLRFEFCYENFQC